ncbi:flagellar basal body P-ring formation chaperone FlgA [Alloyangia pacifica]|uniref:Flagella basal body P-ring formation protein FlgA n=1 Tax=Alloyangia pacifica TaxID=311180 RepID=A0A1I6T0H0_9RHOB|nr:flagellar basal body P-ring formation chaperone FlgA [Alloyangia pacifica]SDG93134.1 flagella basal body P-ring formation protein FlgA [Alloyangia pacifica]SFS82652.1 flagella basal body P-ring formation protein FlgA [Alloyangia pacifica]
MHRLAALLSLLMLAPLAAPAETPDVLIEEQARMSWAEALPAEADLRVRFKGAQIKDAETISAFWMDRDSGQFLANAVTAEGVTHRLQGFIIATRSLPVPTRRLMPGEVIGTADIKLVDMPLSRVGAFTVLDAEKLDGMQVRRMLSQGRPVMTQSVMEPLVVGRGDKVNILYDDGRLVVTAPGRALTDAHRGQEIRIVNLVSNTPLVAVARAEGLVEVIR